MNTPSTPRPTPLPVLFDNIPRELTARGQWVLWRYTWTTRNGKGKWDKPPFTMKGDFASSTDPSTWATFDAVRAAYAAGGWDGVGYVHLPDENLTAGDADKCRDRATGTITGPGTPSGDAAAALLEFRTYTEVSPSGTGLRTFAYGRKPGRKCRRGPFELYDWATARNEPGGRFLTLTGHRVPDCPAGIEHRQEAIDRVYHRYWPEGAKGTNPTDPPPPTGDTPTPPPPAAPPGTPAGAAAVDGNDTEILQRAFANKTNGGVIRALFDGDITGYPSHSEADQALCNHLAYWFNRDEAAIDRVFRTSKLYRAKWDRDDYRKGTIARALESVSGRKSAGREFAAGSVNDGDDNPHRLAGVFLDVEPNMKGHLRFFRQEWHLWDQGAYRVVPEDNVRPA